MKKLSTLMIACMLMLLATTSFSQVMMDIGTHSSTFSGNTRGYWFTSPTCFTITKLRVPTSASSGLQNIQVVKFRATPPFWSTTTNDFETLFLVQNGAAADTFDVNIPVQTGDIIGILGCRGNSNSYRPSPHASSILGMPVTLTRLGFQDQLQSTPAYNVWQESGGSISGVEMYYDSLIHADFTTTMVDDSTFDFLAIGDTTFGQSTWQWAWDFGDGGTDTTMNPTHIYTADGSYTVCLTMWNNCGDSSVFCDTITVCTTTLSAGFSFVSADSMAWFTDTSAGASMWSWDFGDGGTSSLSSPSHTYGASGSYLVTLIVENACGVADTVSDTVTICMPPSASYMIDSTDGLSIWASDMSWTDMGVDSIVWDMGDGTTLMGDSVSHTYGAIGYYVVCMTFYNTCGSDTHCDTIFACTPPTASFTSTDMGSGNISFFSSSSFADSIEWDFGDGSTGTGAGTSHTYTANGTYTVCMIATNACGADTTCDTLNVIVLGTENELAENIKLMPNPVNNVLTIDLTEYQGHGSITAGIYDLAGKLMLEQSVSGRTSLNVESLPSGIYFCRIAERGSVIFTQKVIKH